MKKFLLCLVAVFVAAFMLLGCGKQQSKKAPEGYQAKVDWIHDGDTVTVIDNAGQKHKLRFYAIDAPELAQSSGKESMKNLMKLLPKRDTVTVVVENIDRYGREVSTVYRGDLNVNRQQIADGYAWHYRNYDKKFYDDYEKLEQQARKQRLGLWYYPNAKEPWEYRKAKREKQG